jgi:alkylation response protein AidB-like acyl-CoA dehydrogenase
MMPDAMQTPNDAVAVLANARSIAPSVRARADEIEAARQIPDGVYRDLVRAGVVRMAMPRSWGGPELTPLEQIEVIEVLAHADGSTGWCTSILSDCGFYAGFLEEAAARKLFPTLDESCAGMLLPIGRAEVVEGGFRASGHWRFGSGCRNASLITGGCQLFRNGVPQFRGERSPDWRVLIFASADVEILDTWQVTGLCGTGSHDYQVRDVFVPAEHSFDLAAPSARPEPLYSYHGLFFANVPGVPLGLARRALDEVRLLVEHKTPGPGGKPIRTLASVQSAIAETEGILGSARSYCFDVMGELWHELCAGRVLSLEQRARLALMILHTSRSAERVVSRVCEVAGSSALYRSSPLERLRRDMLAVASHVVHQPRTYGAIGKALLGLDPGQTFF